MGRKKNIKSDRNTGPDGRKRFKFWNYYDDKEFDTEEQLIQYQRQRHFRCPECEVKAHSAPALAVHYEQVHGKTLRGVPNAIPGRDDPRVLIIGLKGVPADMLMGRASGTDFEEDALRIVKQEMAKQGHLTPLNMVGGSSSHPGPAASRNATPGVSGGHQAAASTGVLPGMTNNGTMNGMGMPGMGNKMPGGMNMPGMGMPGGMGGMQGGMPGMPNMAGMAGMMPGGMNPMLMGMMGMMPGMGTPGMAGMQMPGAAAPGGSADASSSASKPVANTAPTSSVQLQLPATGSSLEERKDGAGTPAAAQEEHEVHPGKTANPPEVVRSTVVGDNPFAKDAAPSAAAASSTTPGSAGEVGAPPATAANSGTSSGTGEPQAASTSTSTMPSSGAPGPGAGGAAMPGMMKGMMPGMGMPGMMAGMGMGMPGGGMNPMMMGMMPGGMMKGMPMMPGMMPGMPPMPGMMHPGMKGPGMMPMMPPGGPMGMKGGSKNPNLQPLGNPGGGGPSSGVGGAPQLAASSSSGSGAPVSAAGEQSHMMKGSVSTSTAPFKNMDVGSNPPAAAKSRPPFAGGGANNPNLIPLGSGGAGLGGGPGGSYSGPPAPGAAAPQPSGSIAGGGGRTPVGVGGAGGASSGGPGAGGTTNNQHEQQLKMGLSGKATAPRPAHNGYHDRESQSPLRERSPRREPNDYDQPQKRQNAGVTHQAATTTSAFLQQLHGDEYKKQTLENAKQALFYAYEFVSPEELRACQKPWNRPVRFAETGK